jgi:D-beta-D-heptose 7-phosphate kinase/D-beta-D-heptose 1-phosphate adenosyltransferase
MDHMTLAPGGAANVAANVAGLGATPILVGVVGDDADAGLFPALLKERGVSAEKLFRIAGRPTTVKTRVIAHSQQVARIDQESDTPLSPEDEGKVIEEIKDLIAQTNAVIISDYSKGFLSDTLLDQVIRLANDASVPVLVDPKGKDYTKYRRATLLTPNRREAADACGLEENTQQMVDIAGNKLLADLDLESVLITQGEDGMTLFRKSTSPFHLNTLARDVYDVTGAGDTVIASLAVSVGAGGDLETAARVANVAAGLVVEQVGTTAVSIDRLREALTEL